MSVRVGINGFGRIGRLVFRVLATRPKDFTVVGINDLSDAKHLAHLLKYDSVHGKFEGSVAADGDNLIVNGTKIPVSKIRSPKELPWGKLGVDIAAECTGLFTTRSSEKGGFGDHLAAGAKKVLLSAPAKDGVDATIVFGVNEKNLKAEHLTFSNASCTTNCTAPVVKVLNDTFGIVKGMISTVHAYTNDQRINDLIHEDMRRARAAAINVIPTTTGMSKAISEVIPDLKGKIEGVAFRVPVPTGSLIDCSIEVARDCTKEEVNAALKNASEGAMKGILGYSDEPIVSSDIVHDPHSSIVDSLLTNVVQKRVVKVVSWYDNEWGFSNRMADLMALAAKLK
ncbi:MAG TPA: type I glyceraldehyde-3-phosphate dehydrogenase [Planctomycetota bacterium]|nr:type I glyceraldehyde-3-phosphate dehydrogenase [Planctomycetota bacterium]